MLSKKAKYALKALALLARNTDHPSMGIAEIASQEKIPRKFLEAILLELKNQGLLASRRGKGGGYLLVHDPEDISIGRIIRLMDGPLALTTCASRTAFQPCKECTAPDTCQIRFLMVKVRDSTARILDNTSLRDIVSKTTEIMYMI